MSYIAGLDWHPNLQSEQSLVARGDLPRFVMDSYEECRGPPRLFLLDKYVIPLINVKAICLEGFFLSNKNFNFEILLVAYV